VVGKAGEEEEMSARVGGGKGACVTWREEQGGRSDAVHV